MDDAHDGPYAREPQIEDLVRICSALNDAGARYILIGGFARRRPCRPGHTETHCCNSTDFASRREDQPSGGPPHDVAVRSHETIETMIRFGCDGLNDHR